MTDEGHLATEAEGPTKPRRGGFWRRIALLVFFIGVTALIVLELAGVREFGKALSSIVWYWAVVSALLFAVSFYLWAILYRVGFAAVDLHFKTAGLLGPLMASIFFNSAAPVGEAVFVEHAIEHRQNGARAAAGIILVLVVDLATTIPFIVAGLAYLNAKGTLPAYYVVTSGLFVLVILLFVAALWLARVKRSWLDAALRFGQRTVNKLVRLFGRRGWDSTTWAERSGDQFSDAAASMARHPGLLGVAILMGLLFHLVNAAGLYTLFLAFGQRAGWGLIAAGFAMSIVLYVIAVTPQGVGAAEGVMSLLFVSAGVPGAIAVGIAVTYRILNVWLPLLIGYFFAQRMPLFGGKQRPKDEG
jgi:uncharacterized protein (TIRG00374 family)